MSEKHECTCIRFGECHVHGFRGVASPQATRLHDEGCCLDLDHKGDCKRWMKLPPNSAYPNFKEIHVQDDWCPKAGCVPASPCDITSAHGAAQPAAGTTPTRNSEVLADFAKYCEAHPAQRFWQALRNWSEYHFVEVRNPGKQHLDTFDWEGRRHDK